MKTPKKRFAGPILTDQGTFISEDCDHRAQRIRVRLIVLPACIFCIFLGSNLFHFSDFFERIVYLRRDVVDIGSIWSFISSSLWESRT
ncbi:hypothetical protein PFISCL1PPCAC_15829 [Pristionchus fissidentatus]|uniref:Uncharacterized protein n=1 Tax=Pristionchus fissidentatus TaxID=1538716 RepID=A0AAV5VY43_9BILA|nr:hypothetical protein PFISCL1PPCAC_15829 [Pristionchus fissidentatus]